MYEILMSLIKHESFYGANLTLRSGAHVIIQKPEDVELINEPSATGERKYLKVKFQGATSVFATDDIELIRLSEPPLPPMQTLPARRI